MLRGGLLIKVGRRGEKDKEEIAGGMPKSRLKAGIGRSKEASAPGAVDSSSSTTSPRGSSHHVSCRNLIPYQHLSSLSPACSHRTFETHSSTPRLVREANSDTGELDCEVFALHLASYSCLTSNYNNTEDSSNYSSQGGLGGLGDNTQHPAMNNFNGSAAGQRDRYISFVSYSAALPRLIYLHLSSEFSSNLSGGFGGTNTSSLGGNNDSSYNKGTNTSTYGDLGGGLSGNNSNPTSSYGNTDNRDNFGQQGGDSNLSGGLGGNNASSLGRGQDASYGTGNNSASTYGQTNSAGSGGAYGAGSTDHSSLGNDGAYGANSAIGGGERQGTDAYSGNNSRTGDSLTERNTGNSGADSYGNTTSTGVNDREFDNPTSSLGEGRQQSSLTGASDYNNGASNPNANDPSVATGAGALDEQGYPEQKHAGKVGLGPNYKSGATTGDKISGMMDIAKGKITKNPELVQEGEMKKSGVLQQKQRAEDDAEDPFKREKEGQNAQPGNKGTSGRLQDGATTAGNGSTY
ncbi:hypothetical protein P7C70_g3361, partial [Phenoliferia sp. Uapishka_3]